MKKSKLRSLIKEEIMELYTPESQSQNIQEMAKIKDELKTSIEKVINDNPDLTGLPLKKAIKSDPDVVDALGDQDLYDNQLNKFIATTKGERTPGKRGRKPDPNKPKKPKAKNGRGRPKSAQDKKKDSAATTSKLGGKKYYAKKGGDEPSDEELRKLARSGGGRTSDRTEQLRKQEKKKLMKAFLDDMKQKGIVSSAGKVLDKEKYDAAKKVEVPKIQQKVNQLNESKKR